MHLELKHLFAAPPDRVFDFFADPRKRPRWQRSLDSVNVLTEGPPRRGTRWQESPGGLTTVTVEISEFERPKRWAERAECRFGRMELGLTFLPNGRMTEVLLEADIIAPRLLSFAAALAKPLMLCEMGSDLDRAARLLKAEAGARMLDPKQESRR